LGDDGNHGTINPRPTRHQRESGYPAPAALGVADNGQCAGGGPLGQRGERAARSPKNEAWSRQHGETLALARPPVMTSFTVEELADRKIVAARNRLPRSKKVRSRRLGVTSAMGSTTPVRGNTRPQPMNGTCGKRLMPANWLDTSDHLLGCTLLIPRAPMGRCPGAVSASAALFELGYEHESDNASPRDRLQSVLRTSL